MNSLRKIVVLSVGFALLGCGAGKDKPNVELVTAMMDQESVKAQDWVPGAKNMVGMRVPPENTVPRGFKPYKYKYDADAASKNLKNPYRNNNNPEILSRGKAKYDIYCALCHGVNGKAMADAEAKAGAQIAPFMPVKPPSVYDGKVKAYNDARIFHVITDGWGTMGSYSSQIVDEKDRWAVVNYIRNLQNK